MAKTDKSELSSKLARWRQEEKRLNDREAEAALAVFCRELPWPGPSSHLVERAMERTLQLGLVKKVRNGWQSVWAALFLFLVGWSVAGWGALGPLSHDLLRVDLVASLTRHLIIKASGLAATLASGWSEWTRLGHLASQAVGSIQFASLVAILLVLSAAGASLLHALLGREDNHEISVS